MLGQRLLGLREEAELTQQQVAEAIGSTQQKISNYEKGTVEPDCDTLVLLADLFKTTVDYMLGRSNQRYAEIVYPELEDLPVEAVKEVQLFLEFVRHKYQK